MPIARHASRLREDARTARLAALQDSQDQALARARTRACAVLGHDHDPAACQASDAELLEQLVDTHITDRSGGDDHG